MQVKINGESREWPDEARRLSEVLEKLEYDGMSIAVAINQEFVPRSEYENTMINEHDEIEIVTPIQGGSHVANR